jgi:hypothetical protein
MFLVEQREAEQRKEYSKIERNIIKKTQIKTKSLVK